MLTATGNTITGYNRYTVSSSLLMAYYPVQIPALSLGEVNFANNMGIVRYRSMVYAILSFSGVWVLSM